jgi:hypothetical protein
MISSEVKRMAGSNGTLAPQLQSMDYLFSVMGGQPPGNGAQTANFIVSNSPVLPQLYEQLRTMPADWPALPPALEQSPEARAAFEWLQTERQRLEEYTRAQIAIIHHNHQTLMEARFQHEQAIALQMQRLGRARQMLASQTQVLQERVNALTQREETIAARETTLARVQDDVRALEQARDVLRSEVATHRTALEELQAQLARTERGLAEAALTEAQRALESKQAEMTARQAQMEQRYQALEKAEAAVARRALELDELECRLGKEFEKQERQLALERREIETLRIRLQV